MLPITLLIIGDISYLFSFQVKLVSYCIANNE